MGTVAGTASLFEGDPFWDPVSFSWPLMLILLALCLLLTIVFLVWMALQPEEPRTTPPHWSTRPPGRTATAPPRSAGASMRMPAGPAARSPS